MLTMFLYPSMSLSVSPSVFKSDIVFLFSVNPSVIEAIIVFYSINQFKFKCQYKCLNVGHSVSVSDLVL